MFTLFDLINTKSLVFASCTDPSWAPKPRMQRKIRADRRVRRRPQQTVNGWGVCILPISTYLHSFPRFFHEAMQAQVFVYLSTYRWGVQGPLKWEKEEEKEEGTGLRAIPAGPCRSEWLACAPHPPPGSSPLPPSLLPLPPLFLLPQQIPTSPSPPPHPSSPLI